MYFFFSVRQDESPTEPRQKRPYSPIAAPPSVFSNDIWLGDNCGESAVFAREVQISGWTSVGDALGGAYVGEFVVFRLSSFEVQFL
jgi:hypothetical protein